MCRFGDDDDTALDEPTQGDLRHAFAVFVTDSGKSRIREKTVASLCQRSPGHDACAELLHDFLRFNLLVEDMCLDLVDCRNNLHVAGNVNEVVGIEIAYPDSTEFTFLICFLQSPVCTVTVAERLVQEHQIDVVRLQLAQALINREFRFLVTIVGNPHFRDKKNLFAVDTAFSDCIAYTFFIVVGLCRVNHTIAYTKGIAYTTLALGGRNLIDAIANLGHFDAVV